MQKIKDWSTSGFSILFDEKLKNYCGACGQSECHLRCSVCKLAYCNVNCQMKAWPVHKRFCKNIDVLIEYCRSTEFVKYFLTLSTVTKIINNIEEKYLDEMINDLRANDVKLIKDSGGTIVRVCGDHEFPVFDYEETIKKYGPTIANTLATGCRNIMALPLILFFNPLTNKISGELMAMNCLISKFGEFSPPIDKLESYFLSFNGKNIDKYRVDINQANFSEIIKSNMELRERAVIYKVKLRQRNKEKNVPLQETIADQFDKFWPVATSFRHGTSHTFTIIIVNEEAFILQSYFGHYTHKDWLDFENDLKLSDVPETKMKNWHYSIKPRPLFRGKLNQNQLIELVDAISTLTKNGNHTETFANITGIIANEDTINTSYILCFSRCDLDHQIIC